LDACGIEDSLTNLSTLLAYFLFAAAAAFAGMTLALATTTTLLIGSIKLTLNS